MRNASTSVPRVTDPERSAACWMIALAAMFAGEPAVEAQTRVDAVPVTIAILYEGRRVYVPVAAASGPLGWFILDTGADDSLIDTTVSDRVGVRVLAEETVHGAGRGSLTVGRTDATTLYVGSTPLRLDSAEVASLDARLTPYSGRHIGGLIGSQFFREHVVTVDFDQRRLELRNPRTFDYHGSGLRSAFRLVDGVPIVAGAITLPDGSSLPLRLLVDLGADANLLVSGRFVSAHPALARLAPSIVEPLGAGVGGETRYAFTRLPKLQVGPISASDLVVGLSENGTLRGGAYDALLGAQFLQRYRVTFDYAHGEIIFEPNPRAKPDAFDRSGAYLIEDSKAPHRLTIHFVAKGSPAAEAGLAPGDVVRTIDGRDAGARTLAEIREALTSDDHAAVPITVERAGRPIDTVLKLRDLL